MDQTALLDEETGVRRGGKYLTFMLGREAYGLEILRVREIIGMMDITRVPRMPEFVCGVINLRGRVIPVVDLRARFGMDKQDTTKETCIIVVDLENCFMGIVVDSVWEVLDIHEDEIDETPEFGIAVDTEFIKGMGKAREYVIMLLDIAKVLKAEEFRAIAELAD